MITVENAQAEKQRFKRMFSNVSSVGVSIIPKGNGVIILRIQSDKLCFETRCIDTTPYTSTVYLSFVDINDCLFDLLFAKDGFFMELYPKAYRDIKTISTSGVEGFISQVIFKTRRKTTKFMAACNEHCKMIM